MMIPCCDTHIHSHFSADSQMCLGAISHGLHCVTFIEHVDMNPHDSGYKFFQPKRFFEKIHKIQETFAGELKILKGVEFGESFFIS